MSDYKYLVLKLDKPQNVNASINIYPESSIWTPNHSHPIDPNTTTIAIPLQEITYTSDGDQKGQPMDVSHISIVTLWAGVEGTIDVADIYLTNNDDYSSETTSISSVPTITVEEDEAVYNLQGIRMPDTDNLPRGIYIRGGKKFVIR